MWKKLIARSYPDEPSWREKFNHTTMGPRMSRKERKRLSRIIKAIKNGEI